MTATRRVSWVPWALFLAALAISAAAAVVAAQNDLAQSHALGATDELVLGVVFLLPVTFTGVGAFVETHRPGNRIGWLMMAIGLGAALEVLTSDYPGATPQLHQPTRPFGDVVAWVSVWIGGIYLCSLLLLLLLFPTGHLPSRRWKPVMWLGLVGWMGLNVLSAAQQGPINDGTIDNPFGIVTLPDTVESVFILAGLAAMLAGVLSLVLRFRSADGDVRQQLKWFTYGACLAIVLQLGGFITSWSNALVAFLSVTAIAALPVFMGIAILRYRLYDIDLLINRTLVYGLLTVSLAGLYIGSILLLQGLSRALIGQDSQLAVAISTLAVAALFSPWRRRVQTFIDRRFYRRKYDAVRILAGLQTTLRDEVELDQLSQELVSVVQETVQARHVSLWLP